MKLLSAFRLFTLILIASLSLPSVADQNSSVNGALCLIRSGDSVVLIHEILTDKLALPGGYVEGGEHPAITAQREAWEETGLSVTVKGELLRAKNAIIFDCVSDSEIIAYQHRNQFGGVDLPLWFAPHYGIEVSSAMLVEPSIISPKEYRFPVQLGQVIKLLPHATDQPMVEMANLVEAAPHFQQLEIEWILGLQQAVSNLPANLAFAFDRLLSFGLFLTQPLLLLVLFPLIYWRLGTGSCLKLLFVFSVTSILALAAQQGIALPRPHAYLPMINLSSSFGFSLPSVEAAVWVSVGILLLRELGQLGWNEKLGLLSIAIAWMGLANFYTGSAFVSDTLSGTVLGLLCAWHIIRLEEKATVNLAKILTSKGVWLCLVATSSVAAVIWTSSAFVGWLATTVTLTGFVLFYREQVNTQNSRANLPPIALAGVVLILLASSLLIDYLLTLTISSSVASLALEALRYPMAIMLFVTCLGMRKVGKEATV